MEDFVSKYNSFVSTHSSQLEVSGLPKDLWPLLHQKLLNEIFDAQNLISAVLDDNGYCLCVSNEKGLLSNSNVFLVGEKKKSFSAFFLSLFSFHYFDKRACLDLQSGREGVEPKETTRVIRQSHSANDKNV